jgi:hypothetical protein
MLFQRRGAHGKNKESCQHHSNQLHAVMSPSVKSEPDGDYPSI